MFVLIVRFQLHLDTIEAFDKLVLKTLLGIESCEPGTISYIVHANPESPAERVFYECYKDLEAFEFHEMQEHTRLFLKERQQYLVSDPEVFKLIVSDGFIAKNLVQ